MIFRVVMSAFVLVVLAVMGAGGWWVTHRKPDPSIHAREREAQGDLRETLLLERSAVSGNPGDAEARMQLARSLMEVYDGAAAEKSFRAAQDLGADKWAVLQGIGESEIMQKQWQRVLDDLPDTGPAAAVTAKLLLMRGTAQLALKQHDAAKASLAAAQQAAPGEPDTLMLGILADMDGGDKAATEAKLDALLQKAPDRLDALVLKLALVQARSDQPGSLAVANHILQVAPWAVPPRLERANLLMLKGDDTKARQDVNAILSRMPRLPGALYLNAVLLARAGKLTEADAAFDRLGPVTEMFPRALYIHAVVQARQGNIATADDLATRYTQRFPNDRDAVLLAAFTHLQLHRPDLAVPLLEQALALAKSAGGPADPAMLSLLGDAYAGVGNAAAALRVREQAASAAPNNAGVLAGLGLSQMQQGDAGAAVATLERATELAPPPLAVSESLFRAAVISGDLDRAGATLDRRRAQDGETLSVGLMAASLALARGDLEEARQKLEQVAEKFPDAAGPKIELAKLLLVEGRRPEAETQLRAILDKDPANLAALSAAVQLWSAEKAFATALPPVMAAERAAPGQPLFVALHAEMLVQSGDPKAALDLLSAKEAAGPLPPILLNAKALALTASGERDKAIETYARVVAAVPGNLAARAAQVQLLMQANRLDDAAASLQAGLARLPGSYGLMHALVALAAQRGGLDAGLKKAAEFRAQPDTMPAAAYLAGDLLMETKQFDRAAQAFKGEFDQAPSSGLALRLSKAQFAAGQADAAMAGLRAWSKNHPGDPDVLTFLGGLEVRAKQWDEAQADFEATLQRRPTDVSALNDLAWIYALRHDGRALGMAKRAYQLAPMPQIADTLGWIMLQQGDVAPALALLQGAASQRPEDTALTYHLAVAFQKAGRPDDSVKLLDPLLARPAAFDDRPAAEQLLRELKGTH